MSTSTPARSCQYIRRLRGSKGFTLVELMVVVAMVGVLSAIAMVGYGSYLNSARTADAKAIVSAIRISQETHRAETLSYLNCSNGSLTGFYPVSSPDGKRRHFKGHAGYVGCWDLLNITTDTPTTFTYAVVAGGPGDSIPAPSTTSKPTWPTPTEPWFVIQAAGDADQDGVPVLLLSSSFNGEIYVENEGE